jgi:hypothetical protein
VKPQRKASPGVVEEDFASSDDEEGENGDEEVVEVAPRMGPLIKMLAMHLCPLARLISKQT